MTTIIMFFTVFICPVILRTVKVNETLKLLFSFNLSHRLHSRDYFDNFTHAVAVTAARYSFGTFRTFP